MNNSFGKNLIINILGNFIVNPFFGILLLQKLVGGLREKTKLKMKRK